MPARRHLTVGSLATRPGGAAVTATSQAMLPAMTALPPIPASPAPKQAWSEEELAKRLWFHGFRRWLDRNPDWSMGRPFTGNRRITFHVTSRRPPGAAPAREGGRSFQIVIEPADGALEPTHRGRNLAVRPQGDDVDPRVADELGRVVMALDHKGLGFEVDVDLKRVELFISSACNLQCYFCMESERISQRSFMPWATIEARIRHYAAAGVNLVQFMGGEATIHPRFVDALRLCRELGLRTFVITNLTRWSNRGFAEDVGPLLDEVMVSLHAYGEESGKFVTGQESWWDRFEAAQRNFLETTQASNIRASTVISKANLPDLERIADRLMQLKPERWIMGNAVPIDGTRLDAVTEGFRLAELEAMRDRFVALNARVGASGCRLVFFCFPHCTLGPDLWDLTHDDVLDNQDLSDDALKATKDVSFWSQADYHERPRQVTLGRTRTARCAGCARASRCGGHFTDYFERYGDGELHPIVPG